MSMDNDQFRKTMVSNSAAGHGDHQHGDGMIKNVDQVASNQPAFKHDGSGFDVIGVT